MKTKQNLKKITVTALFCALAFLMTFIFRFKVSFLTFDFKDAIISIVSLLYGPVYGITGAGIVAVLEFLSVSDTGVYGLIMNFISSSVFALSCGLVYKFKRSFYGAIFAVTTAVISVTAVMMVANIFITPFYMGVDRAEVIGLIPVLLLPFNLCKSIINATAVLIIYKPVTNPLKKLGMISTTPPYKSFSKKSVILIIVSVVILLFSIMFIIFEMGGSFSLFK